MIQLCKEQWMKNEDNLKKELIEFCNLSRSKDKYNSLYLDYKTLVKLCVTHILNKDGSFRYDIENITEIDNGEYQGTLLYLIPLDCYQPCENEYLITYVCYGSCSVCDTLQGICYDTDSVEQQISDLMTLCRDIVMRMKNPYSNLKEFSTVTF